MHRSSARKLGGCLDRILASLAVAALACGATAHAEDTERTIENNFGFPLGFSVTKMDRRAPPGWEFARFAAGNWLGEATIPNDEVRISTIDVLVKTVEIQLRGVMQEAVKSTATAEKGTPLQQVGDFYASGMDEKALYERGITPLQPLRARIDRSQDRTSLSRTLARLALETGEPIVLGVEVDADIGDRTRYAVYVGDADLPIGPENYLRDEALKVRNAYGAWITSLLTRVGRTQLDASMQAKRLIEQETRIAAKKLTPVQKQDPNTRFVRMRYADLKALLSNLDVDAYFAELGVRPPEEIIVTEVDALRERNALLGEAPNELTRTYLLWNVLRALSAYLAPDLVEPGLDFISSVYGTQDRPARSKYVEASLTKLLGHPLSQLYVAKHFPVETKIAVEDLVGRVRAEYRQRLASNTWLSEPTRQQALIKLDKIDIGVGYPTHWIDFSGVEVRRDDYFGNALRLNTFTMRRGLDRLGKPVAHDGFAVYGQTLPVTINAGYNPMRNGIEIPAAFLQPPFYDAKADAAVNYCALGAVIGHELTHGFDSQGRLFDADGQVRNWWTPADEQYFVAETQKLVEQANAYRISGDLHVNGQLAVGENLADVGGIRFAYGALQGYLRDHPDKDRDIDGLSPSQRCFVSWAQVWADKAREGWLRQVLAVDPHPPGMYRMIAPAQHHPAFYEAFVIRDGDGSWLAPERRVNLW